MKVEQVVEVGAKGRVWALSQVRLVGGWRRELRRGDRYVDPRAGVLKAVNPSGARDEHRKDRDPHHD